MSFSCSAPCINVVKWVLKLVWMKWKQIAVYPSMTMQQIAFCAMTMMGSHVRYCHLSLSSGDGLFPANFVMPSQLRRYLPPHWFIARNGLSVSVLQGGGEKMCLSGVVCLQYILRLQSSFYVCALFLYFRNAHLE